MLTKLVWLSPLVFSPLVPRREESETVCRSHRLRRPEAWQCLRQVCGAHTGRPRCTTSATPCSGSQRLTVSCSSGHPEMGPTCVKRLPHTTFFHPTTTPPHTHMHLPTALTHQLDLFQVSRSQAGRHRPDLPRPDVPLPGLDVIRVLGVQLAVPVQQPAALVPRVDRKVVEGVEARQVQAHEPSHDNLGGQGLLEKVALRKKVVRQGGHRAADSCNAGHLVLPAQEWVREHCGICTCRRRCEGFTHKCTLATAWDV